MSVVSDFRSHAMFRHSLKTEVSTNEAQHIYKIHKCPYFPIPHISRMHVHQPYVNMAALLKGIRRQRSGANVLVCEDGREAYIAECGSAKALSQRPRTAPFQSRPNRL